jgi:uncharacterized protein involved in exopolysaccharide biosynthesis
MTELALEQTLDLGDYLSAFKRRRGMVLLIAGIVFVFGLIIASVWPPTYQSASTILIEEQEIPSELIQATVTSYAAQRIQVISQRVMTRDKMMNIIEKYGLYSKERKRQTTEEILTEMREDILVDMITAEVMDPRTGRPTAATIAFTVGFEGESPKLVQKVASELTTLYLNENLRTRTEKSAETYDFISEEARRYKEEISRLEAEIVEFNKKYVKVLPENKALNTAIMERTERELQATDQRIASTEQSIIYLESQLALLNPHGMGTDNSPYSPELRLEALRTEYLSASTRYSADHPDVKRLKQEILALEQETGQVNSSTAIIRQLEELHSQLAVAAEKYSEDHPDVKRLRNQIDALETGLANQPATSTTTERAPTSPAYIDIRTELEVANSNLRSLRTQRSELMVKISDYEQRLLLTPQVESEYRALVRDYENASVRYQTIQAKQMAAEVGKELEKERKGERFTLIDPAILPEEPVSPNRPAIIFLSLVLALGAGVGSAAVTESMDSAVRGAKGLVAVLNTAPLAVIPYLDNAADTGKQKKRQVIMVTSVIGGGIIILLLIHFLYSPLDVLWFRGMRKVDTIIGE